jgi:hypothetical protein
LAFQFGRGDSPLASGFAALTREEIIAGIGETAGFRLDRLDHDLHDRVEILFSIPNVPENFGTAFATSRGADFSVIEE